MKTRSTEDHVQVFILLAVAGMAGAASFTHVHDWTMANTPAGTSTWFGWANAVITELVPSACGIEIRRRKRRRAKVTYPMAILVTDAAISLAVQLSDAIHTLGGGLAVALPALAFLALTKLVLSRPAGKKEQPAWHQNPDPAGEPDSTTTGTMTPDGSKSPSAPPAPSAEPSPSAQSPAPALPSSPQHSGPPSLTPDTLRGLRPVPSGQLLISARMVAFSHQQETGQPITSGELAARMKIPPALAESLLDHLGGTPPPVTDINGTVLNGSRP